MSITVTVEHLIILASVVFIVVYIYRDYRFRGRVNKTLLKHGIVIDKLDTVCVDNNQKSQCNIDSDSPKERYLNGKELTEEEFNNRSICTTYDDGTKRWYNIEGQLHRTDGPAVERVGGTKQWWLNGLCHRVDGPAMEWADGDKEWWINGKLHRTDGPAIECSDGTKEWYIEGEKLTEEEFNIRSMTLTFQEPSFITIRELYSRAIFSMQPTFFIPPSLITITINCTIKMTIKLFFG